MLIVLQQCPKKLYNLLTSIMTQDPKEIAKKKKNVDDEFIEFELYKMVSGKNK